jgi:hypothetical protein
MRVNVTQLCVVVSLLVMAGCDDTPKVVPGNGFVVSKGHDARDGNIVMARKSFTNPDGYTAQVTLKCAADAKTFAMNQASDLSDVNGIFQQIYNGTWSNGLVGGGIQYGCPEGFQCGVVANVTFLTPAEKPDTPAITNQAQHPMVIYESRDASSASEQYFALMDRASSSYDDKAINFLVPTQGRELSMWFYRFQVKGDSNPIEVVVDYSTPNLVDFVHLCNSRLPQQSDTGAIK